MEVLDHGGLLKVSPDVQLIAEQQKEYKRVGRLPVKPGHTLFSVNTQTMEVLPVTILKQIAVNTEGKPVKIQKTNYDPKLYYTSALNKKNALKHYRKAINQYFQNLKFKKNENH